MRLGDPLDDATDVGPLITERAARHVEAQVNKAVEDGAFILVGGKRRGAFYDATVLSGVRSGRNAFREEIFGPVLPIIPFASFDEALALANDSPYGLQPAIYTHDVGRIMQGFRTLEVEPWWSTIPRRSGSRTSPSAARRSAAIRAKAFTKRCSI